MSPPQRGFPQNECVHLMGKEEGGGRGGGGGGSGRKIVAVVTHSRNTRFPVYIRVPVQHNVSAPVKKLPNMLFPV